MIHTGPASFYSGEKTPSSVSWEASGCFPDDDDGDDDDEEEGSHEDCLVEEVFRMMTTITRCLC